MSRGGRPVPRETLERLCRHLDHAYETAWYLADVGRVDWSTLGEPIVAALRIVRSLRDEQVPVHHAQKASRRLAA